MGVFPIARAAMLIAIRIVSIALQISTWLDALQQQLELRAVDFARVRLGPVGNELPSLKTLGPNTPAASIEVQHLDLRAAAVDEYRSPPVGSCVKAARATA